MRKDQTITRSWGGSGLWGGVAGSGVAVPSYTLASANSVGRRGSIWRFRSSLVTLATRVQRRADPVTAGAVDGSVQKRADSLTASALHLCLHRVRGDRSPNSGRYGSSIAVIAGRAGGPGGGIMRDQTGPGRRIAGGRIIVDIAAVAVEGCLGRLLHPPCVLDERGGFVEDGLRFALESITCAEGCGC